MRIALIHDWLDTWGGGENVLAALLALYPEADLFALVDFLSEANRAKLGHRPIRTSFIQRLPFARRHFRKYFALMPHAVEQFDLSPYELVISSSHSVAKGVRTGPGQLHICLCYSPARYAWDLQPQYLAQTGLDRGVLGWLARLQLARFRRWDVRASARVDRFVAISEYIAQRIRNCYRRDADVIYPPVDVPAVKVDGSPRESFYLTVSRLVPYKRIDLLVQAFSALPGRQLVVAGDGPEMKKLARLAGPNVRLLGVVDDAHRDRLLRTAKAFVFAADEDFGIAPLEAQAQGTPVIAFGRGASAETIRGLDAAAPTGVLFAEQTIASIGAAVAQFEASAQRITAAACRANAERFSRQTFNRRFSAYVTDALAQHRSRPHP
ncbi:MAG TPA: glycosyltransferase [Casimicrobiaceae bacterium]|jgi:glycosyltransferase involved in cell wall biosynthesis|nr:glycosyltransferase [Casimicrobiaceae bacterium]